MEPIVSLESFFQIVFEDNHLLVVSKQPGLLVQGDDTGDPCLLDHAKQYLKEKYNKPRNVFCGLVHRLDRPVSGIVVLAKTSKALERMNKLFHDRAVQKIYWALVQNAPPLTEDTLVHWLLKDTKTNRAKYFKNEVKYSQRAELHYRVKSKTEGFTWLEVTPLTGRFHQIRVQLSAIGCPIAGDTKYGFPHSILPGRIGLHARALNFNHPVTGQEMKLMAPLPDNLIWQPIRSS